MIIGLTGHKRSGKDTVAQVLVNHYGFIRLAFADTIKDVCLDINPIVTPLPLRHLSDLINEIGWERAKDEHLPVRMMLQNTGTAIRALDPSFWTRVVLEQIAKTRNVCPVVVSDVRLPGEADATRELGGHIVRVVRPGLAEGSSPSDMHITETAMDDYPDITTQIVNDGTIEQLTARVCAFCESLAAPEAS